MIYIYELTKSIDEQYMLLNPKVLKRIEQLLEVNKIKNALSCMEEYIEENILILLRSRFSNLKHLKKDITTDEYNYTLVRIKDSIYLIVGKIFRFY